MVNVSQIRPKSAYWCGLYKVPTSTVTLGKLRGKRGQCALRQTDGHHFENYLDSTSTKTNVFTDNSNSKILTKTTYFLHSVYDMYRKRKSWGKWQFDGRGLLDKRYSEWESGILSCWIWMLDVLLCNSPPSECDIYISDRNLVRRRNHDFLSRIIRLFWNVPVRFTHLLPRRGVAASSRLTTSRGMRLVIHGYLAVEHPLFYDWYGVNTYGWVRMISIWSE